MASDVGIINAALGNLGHTIFIASREESSNEASVANVYYDDAVLYVLEDFAWGFARDYTTLGLIEEEPNDDWLFSYQYPADCAKVRRVVVAGLGRSNPAPPPFVIGYADGDKVVFTNQEDAVVEFTRIIDDEGLFSSKFAEALSWWLAFKMVPGLAKDEKSAAKCLKMYESTLRSAQASDRNESQDEPEPDSDAIRARG